MLEPFKRERREEKTSGTGKGKVKTGKKTEEAAKAEKEAACIEKTKNKVHNTPFKAGTKRCCVNEPRVTQKKARGDMDVI